MSTEHNSAITSQYDFQVRTGTLRQRRRQEKNNKDSLSGASLPSSTREYCFLGQEFDVATPNHPVIVILVVFPSFICLLGPREPLNTKNDSARVRGGSWREE